MNRADSSGIAALLQDYRRFAGARLWQALGLMTLGSLAEGFGLLMIVPLATIAIKGPTSVPRLAAFVAEWSPAQRFGIALAMFVLAMAARAALLFARDVTVMRLQAGYEADLKLRVASTLARRGWPFASRIGQDGLQSLLLTDVPRVALAASYLQNVALAGIMLAVQLGLALILSPALTLVVIAFLLLGGLSSARLADRGARSGLAISDSLERSTASGVRIHAGLKAALAQGTVAPFLAEYRSTLGRAGDQAVAYTRDSSLTRQVAGFGAALAAATLLFVGVQLLALPFAVLVTSLILFARMNGPAQLLMTSAVQASAHAPSFGKIAGRLKGIEPAVRAAEQAHPLDWTELELDHLAFEHEPGLGLQPASLNLRPGQWLAVTGPSGAGKTTLVDLVAGLLSPASGRIAIDGRPLDGRSLARWRAGIAYVGQDGAVFNDSVRGNLLAEGSGADDDALWSALATVGLVARIRALPNGLDQIVGDRGSLLSGGERQRLVLARALLRRPNLLILDEATAALDPASETALMGRLKALDPRPAALIIAHRESTLAHCDTHLAIQHRVMRPDGAVFADETTSGRVNLAGANAGGKE